MKANSGQRKLEAIARMKMLRLHRNAIEEFEAEGKLNCSEQAGMLYWADGKQMEYVKAFEAEYNATVYHLILDKTEIGNLLSMLYVSEHMDEWCDDRKMLTEPFDNGERIPAYCTYAYVENLDDPICSEIGAIGVISANGGLVRAW